MSSAYPVSITLPVQWGEMDALGHVNNARFFTWFESARIALFERIGMAVRGPVMAGDVGPVLATTTCDFLRPVHFPATIRVSARVARVGETSLSMEYEIADAASGELYGKGSSVAVLVEFRSMQKVRVPDAIRTAIAGL